MGKRTYDWLIDQKLEEFPYKNKECYVFTRTSHEDTEDVKFVNEDIRQFVEKLQKKEGKSIWIVGEENCYFTSSRKSL